MPFSKGYERKYGGGRKEREQLIRIVEGKWMRIQSWIKDEITVQVSLVCEFYLQIMSSFFVGGHRGELFEDGFAE